MAPEWAFIRKKSGRVTCPVALPSTSNPPVSKLAEVLFGDEGAPGAFFVPISFFSLPIGGVENLSGYDWGWCPIVTLDLR
jgi:hypothetical protein